MQISTIYEKFICQMIKTKSDLYAKRKNEL